MLSVALVLGVSGCSWFGGDDEQASTAEPAPVEQSAPAVEVIGAVDPDDVEVGEPQEAPETGQGVYFVSQLYPVSGPKLDQPVLVRMLLDNAVPKGTPLAVAARDGDDGAWRFVKGQADADGTHVEFIVPALATFGVLAVDTDSVSGQVSDAVDEALATDAEQPDDVQRPTCSDTPGAREDGYVAKSWRRPTLGWCLDRAGDSRVLRLVNLRGVPVRVDAPGAGDRGTTGDPARPKVAWDAWTGAVAAGVTPDDTAGDSTATVLAPGQTLEVGADLEPGSSLLVTAADDARNRSVQVLHAAALALSQQVVDFGLAPRRAVPRGEKAFAALLAARPCAEALDGAPVALAKGCLGERALRRAFGDDALLLSPALAPRATGRLLAGHLDDLEADAEQVEQRLEVARDMPDFGVLAGRYTGTGRTLVISADGLVTESYGTADGAVMTLGYQLSEPSVSDRAGTATATVTSVQVLDRSAAGGRAPSVGQAGILSLGADGVLRAPFLGSTYCNAAAAAKGACTDAPSAQPTKAPVKKPRKGGTQGTPGTTPAPAPTTGPAPASP